MEKISCLGPAGSYSELAAKKLSPRGEIVLCANFQEVIGKLEREETDSAVIPIENSIQGGVLQNLDLLGQSNVFASEELVLPIDHRLATREGVKLSQIKRVYSHEQAIGQCAEFLRTNLPKAQCIFTSSTTESLLKLDGESAGIVGAHVEAEGVVLSEENVADEKKNFTRFLRLVRKSGEPQNKSRMIFLCAVLRHEPGTLLALLKIFADCGHNLTRIESRPIKDVFGQYRFFIELEGNIAEPCVQEMLERAQLACKHLRILGAY
ncbi:MAG: hypothetical protein K2G44_05960 [Clostridia bacterium]|nr:hypothetical protein [Clostridia bacterium]